VPITDRSAIAAADARHGAEIFLDIRIPLLDEERVRNRNAPSPLRYYSMSFS
jgi:hypothetical protein